MPPFRAFTILCADADAADHYRFSVTSVTPHSVSFRETSALPEVIDFTFPAAVFDTASGVLSMSQSNDVTHEARRENRSYDGRLTRAIRLEDTTPPFVLSRRFARSPRIEGLRFFDFLGPMEPLERTGTTLRTLLLRGVPTPVRAERFAGPSGDELLLLRRLNPFGEVHLVLGLSRDDGMFSVTLESVE